MLAVGAGALTALNEGRSPHLDVCAGLAGLVGATSAAYIHVDLRRNRAQAVCWPRRRPETSISVSAVPSLSAAADALPHDALALPLSAGDDYVRFASLSKPGSFDESDRDLLLLMRSSMFALDAHLRSLEASPLSLVDRIDPPWASPTAGLRITLRELEVLTLLADGMTAQAIARRLSLSPRTVHKHLGSLYMKLGTHDRLSAVTRGQQMGILPAAIGAPRLGG